MKQPRQGAVSELGKAAVDFGAIGKLIDFNFEVGLDDTDTFTRAWPAVLIGGDLVIDGDVTSKALPMGLEGFTLNDANGYFVIVLGDLLVRGNLEVTQYYSLVVAGDVEVHSYRSHSGNFVGTGELRARDLICIEANEEGGIFRPSKASAPAWVRAGEHYYFQQDKVDFDGVEIDGQDFDGRDRERATHAAFVALGKAWSGDDDDRLWPAVVSCIEAEKVARFLEAYKQRESKPAV